MYMYKYIYTYVYIYMYIYKHSQPSFLSLCKPIQSNNIGKTEVVLSLSKKGPRYSVFTPDRNREYPPSAT